MGNIRENMVNFLRRSTLPFSQEAEQTELEELVSYSNVCLHLIQASDWGLEKSEFSSAEKHPPKDPPLLSIQEQARAFLIRATINLLGDLWIQPHIYKGYKWMTYLYRVEKASSSRQLATP